MTSAPRRSAPALSGSKGDDAHARERDRLSCPSIYASTLPGGRRHVRRLSGADDLVAFGAVALNEEQSAGFHANIVCARYGPIEHGIIRFTPHARLLPGDNFGHDHPVSRLVILLDGSQTVSFAGQEVHLTPGSGLLIPGNVHHSYEVDAVTTRLHVDIAADDPRFGTLLRNVECGHWRGSSPVLMGLSAFVKTLLQRDDASQTWADRSAVRSTLEALICSTIASAPPVFGDAGRAPSHFELALQYIRVHHTDPSLTPTTVAQGIGLSVRTLQRAFATSDLSVAGWIARYRLEHVLGFLRDPAFTDLTIPELGRRAGYGSTVALRRAVIAATGMAPSQYRELHVAAATKRGPSTPCHHGPRSGQRPEGHPAVSA
jgi:AraC-like DNA-binding protein/mannose-6-phosphate isomerase-like protein (cupin superfamily)